MVTFVKLSTQNTKLIAKIKNRLVTYRIAVNTLLKNGMQSLVKAAKQMPYAQQKCHDEHPPLVDAGNGHLYRCWYPLGHTIGRKP